MGFGACTISATGSYVLSCVNGKPTQTTFASPDCTGIPRGNATLSYSMCSSISNPNELDTCQDTNSSRVNYDMHVLQYNTIEDCNANSNVASSEILPLNTCTNYNLSSGQELSYEYQSVLTLDSQYMVTAQLVEFRYPEANCQGVFTANSTFQCTSVAWTPTSAPDEPWSDLASDATGQYLVAVVNYGGIFRSNDSGSTWEVTSAPSHSWSGIASDASGQYLAACFNDGADQNIYTSNDYGANWNQTRAPNEYWTSICSDGTGRYLFALGENIFHSSDYGSTWGQSFVNSTAGLQDIACDQSGQYVVAVAFGIYISRDYGATFTVTSAPANLFWTAVASSSTGSHLVAIFSDYTTWQSGVFTSSDAG